MNYLLKAYVNHYIFEPSDTIYSYQIFSNEIEMKICLQLTTKYTKVEIDLNKRIKS